MPKINFISKSTSGKVDIHRIDFRKKIIELLDGDEYKFSDIEAIDIILHLVGGLKEVDPNHD